VKNCPLLKRLKPEAACPGREARILINKLRNELESGNIQCAAKDKRSRQISTSESEHESENEQDSESESEKITAETMETDATIGDDGTGWEGPVKGNKRLPDPNKDFPPLKIRNTFEPLNRVSETIQSAAAGTSSRPMETSSKRTDAANTNKERPPPPVIIHGFVENFNDLEQMLRRHIGKKYNIKFTRKNTTIYTQNKADWNKIKSVLSQTGTSYHSFTHKDEKTHAFVLQGLGQNPSVEEVQDALREEHEIDTIKLYKMKGTNRPKYLVITDKSITQNQLETQARTLLNTRIEWTRHTNNKFITQCHRCQRWGHATSNCNSNPRCLKCAQEHFTYEHIGPIPKEELKCANCKENHAANDTSCSVYKSRMEHLGNEVGKNNSKAFVPAPAPTTNPWNKETSNAQINANKKNTETGPTPQQNREKLSEAQTPDTASATSLFAELRRLNNQINIKEVLRAIRDLNNLLAKANTKDQKFNVILEFSLNVNEYDF
jgi:hypothetical protein